MRSFKSQSSKRASSKCASAVLFQALEPRVMFCGDHFAFGSAIGTYPAIQSSGNGGGAGASPVHQVNVLNVPVFNSRPGAKATIYLDFNGEVAGEWGSYDAALTPAYTVDANTNAYSSQELLNIQQIFQRVAEKFSPFDINVTTVNPGTFANNTAIRVVIGGDGAWTGGSPGGIAYVGAFANSAPNTAYIFTDNLGNGYAKYVAEATAHEAGHTFGLQHQSTWSGGNKVDEYNSGNWAWAPIMGNSYSSVRGTWWNGTSTNGSMQDDMMVIASATNGFGFSADDYGGSFGSARSTTFRDGKFAMRGVVGSLSDRDMFRIVFTGGQLQLKLRSQGAGTMLDAKFRLYRADGSTVIATDGQGLSETITRTLPAGTYYAMVYSHGTYGDVGQYTMSAYHTAPAGPAAPISAPAGSPFSSTAIKSSSLAADVIG